MFTSLLRNQKHEIEILIKNMKTLWHVRRVGLLGLGYKPLIHGTQGNLFECSNSKAIDFTACKLDLSLALIHQPCFPARCQVDHDIWSFRMWCCRRNP